MRIALGMLAACGLVGCGAMEVAPPRAPVPEIPRDLEHRTTPAEAGTTRVLLEANGDRAAVEEIVQRSTATATARGGGTMVIADGYAESTRPVCIAPCYADLKPGMHELRFKSLSDDRQSEASIQVGDASKTLRHAMGRSESPSAVYALSAAGIALGVVATLIGAPFWAGGEASDEPGMAEPGMWVTAAGVGTLTLSLATHLLTRPVTQKGASTEIASIR